VAYVHRMKNIKGLFVLRQARRSRGKERNSKKEL
jgi:hypothetical protein